MHPASILASLLLSAHSGVAASGDSGPNYISAGAVALGACLMLVNALVSVYLSLGLELQLVIAAARCVLQLSVLGYILVPIFTSGRWYVVVAYAFLMALVGAYEAASRPKYSFKGMFAEVLACTLGSASVFLAYALLLVVRTSPWWEPQYFIPMLGMLLGNCISSTSVGLSALLDDFTTGKDKIELLLSFGATRWEAAKETIARCVRLALTPILNQMNVVGIVSIPGMMTGQILGGSDPAQAARYQMIIMFLIAATSGTGVVAAVALASASILDPEHRLRPERLVAQSKGEKLERRIEKMATWVGKRISAAWKGCFGRKAAAADDGDGAERVGLLPS